MADYYSPTTVEPFIPTDVLSPADSLILEALFQWEPAADSTNYYFAEEGMRTEIDLQIATVHAVLGSSPDCFATQLLAEALSDVDPEEDTILTIALDGRWELILQDIVRRSPALDHLVVTTAFTCTRMRPGAFGGAAVFITGDAVESISTHEFVEEARAKLHTIGGSHG